MNEFDTSALSVAAQEVVDNALDGNNWHWEVMFKLLEGSSVNLDDHDLAPSPSEQSGFFEPIAVGNIDFRHNYETDFCEHAFMNVTVGAGLWMRVLSPGRNYMRVYLTRRYATRQGGTEEISEPLVLIFKPIFKDNAEAHATVSETIQLSRQELDMRGLVTLEVDLLSPAAEAIQSAPCGGTFRNISAADAMQGFFADASSFLTFEGEPLIEHQRIAPGANATKRTHIAIKAGTMLTELPGILQKYHGGIWPTGINRFLQGKTWFFYPPYDLERVDKERSTLTIIKVPDRLYTGTARSWLKDGQHLKILASGDIQYRDNTQYNFMQTGSGRRYGSASAVLDGSWLELKDNKAVAKRNKNMSELRIDSPGYTDTRVFNSLQGFTDNPMYQLSTLAGKKGSIVSLVWNYADHTQIEPGMPCRILFEQDRNMMQLKGVVVGMDAAIQNTERAASMPGSFVTTCGLFIYCQSPEPI